MAKDKIDIIENKIDAKVRDVQGHVKDAAGGLTGDIGLQADGKLDQFTAHMQEDFADLYEEGEGVVEKAVTFVRDKPCFHWVLSRLWVFCSAGSSSPVVAVPKNHLTGTLAHPGKKMLFLPYGVAIAATR